MKKKLMTSILASICLLACLFMLAACGMFGTTNENGKYFLVKNNALDETTYIVLEDKSWHSNEAADSGTYTINGTEIVLVRTNSEEYAKGTINMGTSMTLEMKADGESESVTRTYQVKTKNTNWTFYIILALLVVLLLVWFLFSNRKNKQKQKEYVEQLAAIAPGHKVKSIGGICGIVVEVCDDNTVVIETGTEDAGRSYLKLDKECIAQTDAKGPTQIAREEAEAKRKAGKDAKTETPAPEAAPAPAEEQPAEESAEAGTEEPKEE